MDKEGKGTGEGDKKCGGKGVSMRVGLVEGWWWSRCGSWHLKVCLRVLQCLLLNSFLLYRAEVLPQPLLIKCSNLLMMR